MLSHMKFQIKWTFLNDHFPMCPMKLVWYFLHTSWVTIYAAYVKNFYKSVQNDFQEKVKEKKGKGNCRKHEKEQILSSNHKNEHR